MKFLITNTHFIRTLSTSKDDVNVPALRVNLMRRTGASQTHAFKKCECVTHTHTHRAYNTLNKTLVEFSPMFIIDSVFNKNLVQKSVTTLYHLPTSIDQL